VAEGQEEKEEEEEKEGGKDAPDTREDEEMNSEASLGETVVAKGREPHPRRARFELHKYEGGREGGREEKENQLEVYTCI